MPHKLVQKYSILLEPHTATAVLQKLGSVAGQDKISHMDPENDGKQEQLHVPKLYVPPLIHALNTHWPAIGVVVVVVVVSVVVVVVVLVVVVDVVVVVVVVVVLVVVVKVVPQRPHNIGQ